LIKLIDNAIVPAFLLLATRVVSVIAFAKYFDIRITLGQGGIFFNSPSDYLIVNSYSTLAVCLALTLGLVYIIFKSYVFHDTHITPALTAKLFASGMSSLVQNSRELYTQGAIWLSYSYLLLITTGAFAFYGLVYAWVFATCLVVTVLSTILLIADIENEIKFTKDGFMDVDQEEVLVTISEDSYER
jgi:hypothetical protein